MGFGNRISTPFMLPIRRLFSSSISSTKNLKYSEVKCTNCKFYDGLSALCKINYVDAYHNRMDETICGPNGKRYWELDKTYLLISEKCRKYSLFFLFSSPPLLLTLSYFLSYPYTLMIGPTVAYTIYLSYALSILSIESKEQYKLDNCVVPNKKRCVVKPEKDKKI